MNKSNCFVFSFLIFVFHCNGQATFKKLYFGFSTIQCVQQTRDSGFIATGVIFNGATEALLLKTNSLGDTMWTKYFESQKNPWGMHVFQTTDGGYLLTAILNLGSGNDDICLIRTDSIGDTLWTKSYGGSGLDFMYMTQETLDGGFIMVGYTSSFGAGADDIYLIKTDAIGDTLWTKTIGGLGDDAGGAILQTPDNGSVFSSNVDTNFCLVRLDSSGDTLWTKSYGEMGTEEIRKTADYGYIIYGGMQLAKLDSSGGLVWIKKYQNVPYINGSFDICPDKGFIMTGFGSNGIDQFSYLIKTDSVGDTLWCKDKINSGSYSVESTFDGGYVMGGDGLTKTDSVGNTYCGEEPLNLIVISPSSQIRYPAITISSTQTLIGNPNLQVHSGTTTEIICSSVGISPEAKNKNSSITISPNPVCNNLLVNIAEYSISSISIFNLLGENVLAVPLPTAYCLPPTVLDVSSLPPGLYFLQATTDEGLATAKFIKE